MEATALNATHINVTLIHKGLDEDGKRLTVCPKRGISSKMRPERLHQLKTSTDMSDYLW